MGHKANVIYSFGSWTKPSEDCTRVFCLDKFKISTYVVLIDAGFINTSGSCLLQFPSLFLSFNPFVLLPPPTCFWSVLRETFNYTKCLLLRWHSIEDRTASCKRVYIMGLCVFVEMVLEWDNTLSQRAFSIHYLIEFYHIWHHINITADVILMRFVLIM